MGDQPDQPGHTSPTAPRRPDGRRLGAVLLGLVLLTVALWACVLWLPYKLYPDLSGTALRELSPNSRLQRQQDRLKLQNDARTTLIQGLGALLVLGSAAAGAVVALRQVRATHAQIAQTATDNRAQLDQTAADNRAQLELSEQGHFTDRFTKAIDQLDESNGLAVRLGGLYALERIAHDSSADRATIVEVLCAYARSAPRQDVIATGQAASPDGETRSTDASEPERASLSMRAPDVQAAVTILGRWQRLNERPEVNFHDADLQGARFNQARLQRAYLSGAQLQGAVFYAAKLQRAFFHRAQLQGASLREAELQEAALWRAELRGAKLTRAAAGREPNGCRAAGRGLYRSAVGAGGFHRGTAAEGQPRWSRTARRDFPPSPAGRHQSRQGRSAGCLYAPGDGSRREPQRSEAAGCPPQGGRLAGRGPYRGGSEQGFSSQGETAGREADSGEAAGRGLTEAELQGADLTEAELSKASSQGETAGREADSGEAAGRESNRGGAAGRGPYRGGAEQGFSSLGETAGREADSGEAAGRESNRGGAAGRGPHRGGLQDTLLFKAQADEGTQWPDGMDRAAAESRGVLCGGAEAISVTVGSRLDLTESC